MGGRVSGGVSEGVSGVVSEGVSGGVSGVVFEGIISGFDGVFVLLHVPAQTTVASPSL